MRHVGCRLRLVAEALSNLVLIQLTRRHKAHPCVAFGRKVGGGGGGGWHGAPGGSSPPLPPGARGFGVTRPRALELT